MPTPAIPQPRPIRVPSGPSVRETVEAAWAAAVRSRCPAGGPGGRRRPGRGGGAHLRSRTRRPREQPRAEAGAAAPATAHGHRRGHRRGAAGGHRGWRAAVRGRGRGARVPQHASRDRVPGADARRRPGGGRRVRPGPRTTSPRPSTWSSCPPTRPGPSRSATRAARSWATCCAGCWRRPATTSRGSTTSTTPGARCGCWARPSRRVGQATSCPRRRTAARTWTPWPPSCRTTTWAAATAPGADRDAIVGCLGVGAHPGGHRGQPGAPRRPVRRLDERGVAPRRWLGGACGGAAAGRRPRVRAGRRDVVPLHRLRRRQGSGHLPHDRRAHLLRRRHRLRDREVQPRLRQAHLHLGRRPPRDRGARPQCGGGDGLRHGRGGDAPRRLGALRARRPGGLDEQARRASSSPSTSCSPRSAWTPPAGRSRRARPARPSTSTSSWPASSRRTTRSTTSSTPTPGSAPSCARRPRRASRRPRRSRARSAATRSPPAWRARCCGCRRSSRTPRPPRRRMP